MGNTIQFAVLQKDPARPTPDQLKRVFRSFSHLTDADAVRLAVGAHGILMKHLGQDSARALQLALQAEGIPVAIVVETDLPRLADPRPVYRMELWPQALMVYDPFSRPTAIAWQDVTLVAAGMAQHMEFNRTQTEMIRLQRAAASDARPKRPAGERHKIQPDSQLLLEFILGGGGTRYEIDAAQFAFKSVLDRPGLSLEEKFIWLVREMCRQSTQALFNHGAHLLRQGQETVPPYTNRQMFADEIVWLLWRHRATRISLPSES